MASEHIYRSSALIPDYLRTGAGLLLCGVPLLLVNPASVMVYILGGLVVIFAVFGVRTLIRQKSTIRVDDIGLRVDGPFPKRIPWDEMKKVDLRFFTTQRSRQSGWMQLKAVGGRQTIRVDSSVSDFVQLANTVAGEAMARNLPLDESSQNNLTALGRPPPPGHSGFGNSIGGSRS